MTDVHAGPATAVADTNRRRLATALGLIVAFMAVEIVAGILANSLALVSDAAHILTDVFAFAGTLLAGIVIVTTGLDRADPIASLAVAGLMIWAAYGLLKDSGRVLLEMSPEGMDVGEIGRALADHPRVSSVHDLH